MEPRHPHLEPSDAPTRPQRRVAREGDAWRRALPRLPKTHARLRAPATALRLAALEADTAAWADAVGRALGCSCEVLSTTLAAPCAPIAGASFSVAPGPDLGPVTLRLDPELAAALASAVTGTEVPALVSRPDRVGAAVLGHALLTALRGLSEAGLCRPHLAAAPGAAPVAVLEARVRLGGRAGLAQLELAALEAARLLAALPAPAARALPPDLGRLPLGLQLGLGPVRLPASTLAALAPGDAVCPDNRVRLGAGGRVEGPAFLAAGRGRAALGHLSPAGFRLQGFGLPSPILTEDASMPPEIDGLEVDVRVVLTTVPATLGELAALEPGSVVSLDTPDPRVRLMVGESTVALGELVDVDGVLGVRVLARS